MFPLLSVLGFFSVGYVYSPVLLVRDLCEYRIELLPDANPYKHPSALSYEPKI